jgi:tRNA (adenine22-N1)-methyltransferase
MRIAHQISLTSMTPQLSQRLLAIADMIVPQSFVVDIGTDHALLPIYLLQTKKICTAYAVDKSSKALRQAEKNISLFLNSKQCLAIQSDGFTNLHYNNPAVICIAGMGGQTILSILQQGLEEKDAQNTQKNPIQEIIIQPNKNIPLVRKTLSQWNWFLTQETITKERNLFFITMKWIRPKESTQSNLSQREVFLGPHLLKEKSQTYMEWLQQEQNRLLTIQKHSGIHFSQEHQRLLGWIQEALLT